MPLQTKVNIDVAYGVAGDKATPGQSVYTPINPVAAVDLPVGGFVFPVVDEDGVIDNSQATNVAGDATEVLGFVERVISYMNYDMLSSGTMTVPQGSTLNVAVRGDYWAVSSTAASVGDHVFASLEDGSISTGSGVATLLDEDGKDGPAKATTVDTGWIVKTAGAKGEPIIISNWNTGAVAA